MDRTERLCRQHTALAAAEIAEVCAMVPLLQPMANVSGADMFLDCPSREGDAIVVAEAKPQGSPSSYQKTAVGLLARAADEPAVARTLLLGVPTRLMKAVTHEGMRVVQSVEPVRRGGRVIAVLVQEKREEAPAPGGETLASAVDAALAPLRAELPAYTLAGGETPAAPGEAARVALAVCGLLQSARGKASVTLSPGRIAAQAPSFAEGPAWRAARALAEEHGGSLEKAALPGGGERAVWRAERGEAACRRL